MSKYNVYVRKEDSLIQASRRIGKGRQRTSLSFKVTIKTRPGTWLIFAPWNLVHISTLESGSNFHLGTCVIFAAWNLDHICSMVAEIGGYSGLLLGFSLMDTVAVFSQITKWMFSPAE